MGFPAPALRPLPTRGNLGHAANFMVFPIFLLTFCMAVGSVRADDPKAKPDNTIHIALATPVTPQKFSRPVKFFVGDVIDRAGNPQPMLVTSAHGGIFVDRTVAPGCRL